MTRKDHAATGKPAKRTRIVLVDDHPLVREGLAEVLRRAPDLEICGQAEDRTGALELMQSVQPDFAIVDLALKNSHGLDLIKDIRIRFPSVLILVVSMHDEMLNAERVIRAGASGYITKEKATTNVMEAVRQVLSGQVYVSERLSAHLAAKLSGRPRAGARPGIEDLTDREMQVFELIGRGMSRKRIAERLKLDVNTVETYRTRIRERLQLPDAEALREFAVNAKLEGKY